MSTNSVIAIINYRGKILLGKKRSDSQKFLAGKWHVPGGRVESEESDEEALVREIKEETGLEITVGRYLGSSSTPTKKLEAKWYECFALTDLAIPGSDLEDVQWVSRRDVKKYCYPRAIE